MAWSWRCETVTGDPIEPAEVDLPSFSAQGDAESWLGESWRELAEAGVGAVTLVEGARAVYGPMSLEPPAPSE